jgi:carbon starvation protein
VVGAPTITAPAFNVAPADAPRLFPFLFVTIACGAISGFHGLVSSGTTSKQISCAVDARAIGYGGMLGEGLLALISTLAVSAGLANWAEHYHSFAHAARGGVAAFVEGAATFLLALGVPRGPAEVVIAVMVNSFAATSLDTGVRIQRYILEELGEAYGIAPFRNRYVAGFLAVLLPLFLLIGGKAGQLWRLFGATNQILAGLSLIVVTVWLYRSGRAWAYAGVPMLLVLCVAGAAMAVNLGEYLEQGEYLLLVIGGAIFALLLWVVFEGIGAARRVVPAPAGEAPAE